MQFALKNHTFEEEIIWMKNTKKTVIKATLKKNGCGDFKFRT